jgi:hypothetical protein
MEPSQQNISLAEQLSVMQKLFPTFRHRWSGQTVVWTGDLQPSVLSDRYRVRISYQLKKHPFVNVVNPQLIKRDGESIPHMYPKKRLCLFHPSKGEWNHRMLIAETIIPWTSLWLFYYEAWQVTGEWLGGGEHPNLDEFKKSSRGLT